MLRTKGVGGQRGGKAQVAPGSLTTVTPSGPANCEHETEQGISLPWARAGRQCPHQIRGIERSGVDSSARRLADDSIGLTRTPGMVRTDLLEGPLVNDSSRISILGFSDRLNWYHL